MDSLIEIVPALAPDEPPHACDVPYAPELWPVRLAELGWIALTLLVLRLFAG